MATLHPRGTLNGSRAFGDRADELSGNAVCRPHTVFVDSKNGRHNHAPLAGKPAAMRWGYRLRWGPASICSFALRRWSPVTSEPVKLVWLGDHDHWHVISATAPSTTILVKTRRSHNPSVHNRPLIRHRSGTRVPV